MNRFYQRPLSPAWRTAHSRATLVEPPSLCSERYLPLSAAFLLAQACSYDPAQIRDLRPGRQSLAGICRCRLLSFLRSDNVFTGTT